MRYRAVFSVVLCLSFFFATPLRADQPNADYDEMLSAAKYGGEHVDWTALRYAYADSYQFDHLGIGTFEASRKMIKALDAGAYPDAAAQAQLVLDKTYTNLEAHMVSAMAYEKLGDTQKAKLHQDCAEDIFLSIAAGGDGKSAEKPFVVIAIYEEYHVLTFLGLEPTKQALIHDEKNGHWYDMLTAKNRNGKIFDIYFQIDRVVAAEEKLAERKPAKN